MFAPCAMINAQHGLWKLLPTELWKTYNGVLFESLHNESG